MVNGNQNGGVTSQGYTVFCADEDLSSPTKNTRLVLSNVSILTNSFYENSTGELLKILVYNYLDEIKDTHLDVYKLSGSTISYHNFTYSDLLMTCLVWSLTDSPYKNINTSGDLLPNGYQNIYSLLDYMYTSYKQIQNSLESHPNLVNGVYYKKIMDNKIDSKKEITDVLLDFTNRVVNDYENGVCIPDKAFKNYSNGTVRTYDFAAYETVSYLQNLFAFKVTDVDIKNFEIVFNMSVSKEALNKTVEVGDLVEFVINVKNTGNINLNDVFVTEDKYSGLEYVSYKDSTGKWSYSGSLGVSESANFTVVFKAMKLGNLTNCITSGSNNTNNKTSNATVEVKNSILNKDELNNQTNTTTNTTDNTTKNDTNDSIEELGTIEDIVDSDNVDNTIKAFANKSNGNATGNPLLALLIAISLIGCNRFRRNKK